MWIQFTILTFICCYLVHYYAGPSVTIHVKIWSVITWVLNFGIVLLVPYDLYATLLNQGNQTFSESFQYKSITFEYLALYWSVYILTWTIIPVLQQWQNSGDLESMDRLKRSLRSNGIFYLYMLIGGAAFLGLLIFLEAGGDMGLLTYLKCLATSFGIFLLMILMGYAIVQIPRSLWQESDYQVHLAYLYTKITNSQEQIQEVEFQFKKIISFIICSKNNLKNDQKIQQYCTESLLLIPQNLKQKFPRNPQSFLKDINYFNSYNIELQSLIQHHRLLKRNLAQLRRCNQTLIQHITNAIIYQDIRSSIQSNSEKLNTHVFAANKVHWLWFCKVKKIVLKSLCFLFIFAAFIILISETQVFLTKQSSLLGWLLMIEDLKLIRIFSLIIIIFISYMVYYSLFRLKLSNLYGLYKKESDGPSLMFATINFSRVGVAIVLNFFDMIKMKSIFIKAMATPDMGIMGDWVIKGMPGVLWLIVLSHYFDLWGKLMNFVGLQNMLAFSSHDILYKAKQAPKVVIEYRKLFEKKYSEQILQS